MTTEEPENLQLYLPHAEITPESNYRGREIPPGVECPDCGYDLRGLKRGQPCPECGRLTVRVGDEVHCSDMNIEYLKRISYGVQLVLFGWMVLLPAPFFASIFSYTDNKLLYIADLGVVLTIWGVWLLTDPSAIKRASVTVVLPRYQLLRALVIVTSLAFLIFQSITYGSIFASSQWFWLLISYLGYLTIQVLVSLEATRLSNLIPNVTLGINFQIIAFVIPATGLTGLFLIIIEEYQVMDVSQVFGMITIFLFLCSEFIFIILLSSLQKQYSRIIRSRNENIAKRCYGGHDA